MGSKQRGRTGRIGGLGVGLEMASASLGAVLTYMSFKEIRSEFFLLEPDLTSPTSEIKILKLASILHTIEAKVQWKDEYGSKMKVYHSGSFA